MIKFKIKTLMALDDRFRISLVLGALVFWSYYIIDKATKRFYFWLLDVIYQKLIFSASFK